MMVRLTRTVSMLALALSLAVASLTAGSMGVVTAGDVPAPTPPADVEMAWVVDVVDGDTIRVDRGSGREERLRYIGIDAPETVHPEIPVEPWGPEASAANSDLVLGQQVLLERDVSETDRFDRLLRYVWIETPGGWHMVNAQLVALGLAEVNAYPPDTHHHEYLRAIEDGARQAEKGMHGSRSPTSATPEPTPAAPGLIEQFLDLLFGEG